MTDDELTELLRLVDEPAEDVPIAFERRLWDELSATFDATTASDADDLEARTAAPQPVAITPLDEPSTVRTPWTRWGSLVAAAVVVATIGVLLVRTGGEPDEVTAPARSAPAATTNPPATTPPADSPVVPTSAQEDTSPAVLLDPVEACEQFRVGAAPLVDLPDALESLEPSASAGEVQAVADDIESVRLALVTYAADLEDGRFIDEAAARQLTNASRSLSQALAEIDNGDLQAASRTVASVRSSTANLLQSLDLPGLQYDALGPSIDCVE